MSEQEEPRPLTRRERRLRELGLSDERASSPVEEAASDQAAQTQATSDQRLADEAGSSATPNSSQPEAAAAEGSAAAADEPEISLYDEHGNPRTRREIRRLREEARAAAAQETSETPEESEPASADTEPAPVETVEPSTVAAPAEEPSFDDLLAPTEQFTVVEAQESESVAETEPPDASAPAEPADEAGEVPPEETPTVAFSPPLTADSAVEAESAGEVDAEADPTVSEEVDAEAIPAPQPVKRRLSWLRKRSEEPVQEVPGEEPENADEAPADVEPTDAPAAESPADTESPAAAEAQAESQMPEVAPPAPEDLPEPAGREAEEQRETDAADGSAAPSDQAEDTNSSDAKSSYSFPDIVPPEEWRPVLDDPASRGMQGPATKPETSSDDFDDLISRAVAQEGTAGSSGTAALILPSMPEGEGFSGPIGETGELFVSGSIELPKSLGETGGHIGVHETIDHDDLDELGLTPAAQHDSGPVSARSAVSARGLTESSVVAEPGKEKSKLPLVLSLTGGGLLVAVGAVAIWGFNQGIFG